jgi:hypothetical protein
LSVEDFDFVRDPVDRVAAHLGDRHPEAKGVAELGPVHQDDVVDQRAHLKVAHHRRHPEHLGVLVVVHRRDLMLLHERHEGVEVVAKNSPLRTKRRAVRRQAVDHHALGLELLY